jgi:hypothetical protein
MLKRKQPEVREPGDVVIAGVDPEDAALVAWPVTMIVDSTHGDPSATEASSGVHMN